MNLYQILQEKQWVDLSHQIDEHSPKFPALPALEQKTSSLSRMASMYNNSLW